MYMPYTTSTHDDDDDKSSAEVNIRIIINGIWTDRRGSNKNDKKKSHKVHKLISFPK
jgi:hypothetical protein